MNFDKELENEEQNFVLNLLTQKKYGIFRHIASISFFFLILVNIKVTKEFDGNYDLYIVIVIFLIMLVMFYLNMYVLVPTFLYRKKYINYLLCLISVVGIGFYVMKIIGYYFIEPHRIVPKNPRLTSYSEFIFFSVIFTPFILSSTSLKLFQRWIIDNNRIRQLENKALVSELQALKNQINPHFLFNMLNNLNTLIKKDQEKASKVTIKLSDFLRRHLYENNTSSVYFHSEIKFIEDFLDLEKIRRDHFSFYINVHDKLENNTKVPPNIFTVFIENAVKHSLDADEPSSVGINFSTTDKELIFVCTNTKPMLVAKKIYKGVGLDNVKRRLELLYGENYSLLITDANSIYTLELKLPL